MSKLSLYCEKLIEACWLAAIILAPLFFNVYSSRVFEPDKISLVRSLALVMVAAWLILRLDALPSENGTRPRGEGAPPILARLRAIAGNWSNQNPLTFPALLLVGVYVVSTLASLSPSVSLLGSYQRMQGLHTTLSYLVIFFLAASTIRSKAQIDRAIGVALVVSFPIAFYGIIQHYFLDPLPWGGDVTSRVASNMGNSIFVGAYLIMVLPLALMRLLEHARQTAGQIVTAARPSGRPGAVWSGRFLYIGAILSFVALAAAWALSFEFGAKTLIETGNTATLTPEMLAATASNFDVALSVCFFVMVAWFTAAILTKQRVSSFLLIGVYTLVLAVQSVTLLFTQSRGPLLGILGGLFTFAVLYALVRGAWRAALGAMGLALASLLFLVLFNVAQFAPFTTLRGLPYIGRLGRVFETEGGTGEVRVLIWEGALKLALPHAPLQWPTGGDDALNPLRPLVGYGPETMYVAYNRFYPPDLGHLESRNATPDRSHNETFDALVTTGLIGLIAENLVYLALFYLALKWLGFIQSTRQRNILLALWYLTGLVVALVFGAVMGWQFIGVALPAGMILGFFIYLVGFALLRAGRTRLDQDPGRALLLVALLSIIVAHFVEIHFGIAIVSTRTYFWFAAALLVVVGAGRVAEMSDVSSAVQSAPIEPSSSSPPFSGASRKRARRAERRTADTRRTPAPRARRDEISTAPLAAFAFLTGVILATMAFDYITINSVGNSTSPFDVVVSALTSKATTTSLQPSYAMLWLFVGTLVVALVIGIGEWGRSVNLEPGDWLIAAALFFGISVAVFSIFVFFHVYLIATPGVASSDAILAAFSLFVVFVLVVVVVVGITLLFDYPLPSRIVFRPTNWIVAPVLGIIAVALVLLPYVTFSAVSIVEADMIYKDALSLANGNTLKLSIQRFQQALAMQPAQDYYWLFLGRSYLEDAKTEQDPTQRDSMLSNAQSALLTARDINPLQTDHTANLARLHETWATLLSDPSARDGHYKKAVDYYSAAVRLSPNTVQLYDQSAQVELEYAAFLKAQNRTDEAAQATRAAQAQVAQSLQIDPEFCLTYAVRALTQGDWTAEARDALDGLKYAPVCGDVFSQDGRSTSMQALFEAGDRARAAGSGAQYISMLENEARTDPTVELYTALTNSYSTAGQIDQAVQAANAAIELIPASDQSTLQKFKDFRDSLTILKQAITSVKAAPGDPETHRTLAKAWLARGQIDFALPEYQEVLKLLPNDYDAHRMVTLLLLQRDQITEASSAITTTLALAPANERPFWQKLGAVLDSAQSGQNDAAIANLETLISSVDPKDTVTLQALRELSAKLKASG